MTRATIVTALITTLAFATNANAAITSVSLNRCLAAKLKLVRTSAGTRVACHAKNAKKPDPAALSTCRSKEDTRFSGGVQPGNALFLKVHAKYPMSSPERCRSYDDSPGANTEMNDLATALGAAIPGLDNRCDARKLGCLRNYARAMLKCRADAAVRTTGGGVIVPSCTAKATAKLAGAAGSCLDKAHLKNDGPCSSTADSTTLQATTDQFLDDVTTILDPPPTPTPTPLATPSLTPTRTPTPTPTSTVPGVCADGVVGYGEYCDPPGIGACGPDFACVGCTCACPSTIELTVDAASSSTLVDVGWTGSGHHQPLASNAGLTLTVSGCSGGSRPCGACTLGGPILSADADAGRIHNRRCTNDTAIKCADDVPCLGGGGTCEFFFGSNLPLTLGGVGTCQVSQLTGPVSGTFDVESGAIATDLDLTTRIYRVPPLSQEDHDSPCPRCLGDVTPNDGVAGGTCESGPRDGLACDGNADVPGRPDFGTVSLDCPPPPSALVATLSIPLDPTTGSASRTLAETNPRCTTGGLPLGLRCFCDTCNNANAELCTANADCPMSGGAGGICGGRRCIGGTNVGAPCTTSSECPGGNCTRPGFPTAPNSCLDDSSDPGLCVDTAPTGDGRGECVVMFGSGPTSGQCSNHPQRPCSVDLECDGVLGACVMTPRKCFLDNGNPGGELRAVGNASAPVADTSSPMLASVYCVAPTSSSSLYNGVGLPGPARLTMTTTLVAKP